MSSTQIPVLRLAICSTATSECLEDLLKHSGYTNVDIMSPLSKTVAQKHSILRFSGWELHSPGPGNAINAEIEESEVF